MRNIRTVLLVIATFSLLIACGTNNIKTDPAETNEANVATPLVSPTKILVSEADLAHYSPDMKQIYDRGTLRVAMLSKDRVPFFYVNNDGTLTGSDVEMATDIAAKFGVDIEFIRTAATFEEIVDQVASREADIAISKLSATLSRAKKVLFSQPYLTLYQGLLINRLGLAHLGKPNTTLLDLIKSSPIQIGVVSGTSYVSYAEDLFPLAEVVQFNSAQEAMDEALLGNIAAIFYDQLQLKQLIENNPEHSIELQLVIINDRIDPITIAIPPDHIQMLTWINLYLNTNEHKTSSLLDKYGVLVGDSLGF